MKSAFFQKSTAVNKETFSLCILVVLQNSLSSRVIIQEGCDLAAGAGGIGIELAVANAGGDAVLDGPSHSLRVVAVGGNVSKAGAGGSGRLAHGAPQHGDHLGAADGAVGVRAVRDSLLPGPILCLFVPDAAAGQVRVILPREDRPKLRPGGGVVGRVDRVAYAVHEATGADEVDGVLGPMVSDVDKALGVVHDLHRRAAVDRQPDAVLGGQGAFDDLLHAVGVDENRHRAGLHVGNGNFHLSLARVLRQLDLDGGGGAGIAGSLDLNGRLDGLAVALGGLNGLAAEGGLRRGPAVLVGLHRAGGAVSGLGLGNGAAVGIGGGLDGRAVLAGDGLNLGAVGLGLGLDLGAVGLGGDSRIGLAGAGGGSAGAAAAAGGQTGGNSQLAIHIGDFVIFARACAARHDLRRVAGPGHVGRGRVVGQCGRGGQLVLTDQAGNRVILVQLRLGEVGRRVIGVGALVIDGDGDRRLGDHKIKGLRRSRVVAPGIVFGALQRHGHGVRARILPDIARNGVKAARREGVGLLFAAVGERCRVCCGDLSFCLGDGHADALRRGVAVVAVARDLVPDGVLTGVLAGGDGSTVICAIRAILHRAAGGETRRDERLRLAGVGQSGDRCRRGAGGGRLGDGELRTAGDGVVAIGIVRDGHGSGVFARVDVVIVGHCVLARVNGILAILDGDVGCLCVAVVDTAGSNFNGRVSEFLWCDGILHAGGHSPFALTHRDAGGVGTRVGRGGRKRRFALLVGNTDAVCTCTRPITAGRHCCRLGATVISQRICFRRSDRHAAAMKIRIVVLSAVFARCGDGCAAGGIRPAVRVRAFQLQLVVDPNK